MTNLKLHKVKDIPMNDGKGVYIGTFKFDYDRHSYHFHTARNYSLSTPQLIMLAQEGDRHNG